MMAATLAGAHALKVDGLDRLMDLRIGGSFGALPQGCGGTGAGLVVCITKSKTPVGKIRAHDKRIGCIRKIGRKDFAERPLGGGRCVADHYRDQRGDIVAMCPESMLGCYFLEIQESTTYFESIL